MAIHLQIVRTLYRPDSTSNRWTWPSGIVLFFDILASFAFMTWLISGSPCLSNGCSSLASYRILFIKTPAFPTVLCWVPRLHPSLHPRPHLCPEPQIQVAYHILNMSIHVSSRPLTKLAHSPLLAYFYFPHLHVRHLYLCRCPSLRKPSWVLPLFSNLLPYSHSPLPHSRESLSWHFASRVFSTARFSPFPPSLPQFIPTTSFTWIAAQLLNSSLCPQVLPWIIF